MQTTLHDKAAGSKPADDPLLTAIRQHVIAPFDPHEQQAKRPHECGYWMRCDRCLEQLARAAAGTAYTVLVQGPWEDGRVGLVSLCGHDPGESARLYRLPHVVVEAGHAGSPGLPRLMPCHQDFGKLASLPLDLYPELAPRKDGPSALEARARRLPPPPAQPGIARLVRQRCTSIHQRARVCQYLRQVLPLLAADPSLSRGTAARLLAGIEPWLQEELEADIKAEYPPEEEGDFPGAFESVEGWLYDHAPTFLEALRQQWADLPRRREALKRARSSGLVLVDHRQLSTARPEWAVEGVLVRGQPCLFGGPNKSLKTSLAVELAVALAAGRPFLGRYAVPRPLRVALFSGESGEAALADTARRVTAAKGLDAVPDGVRFCTRLPRLAVEEDLDMLRFVLEDFRADVAILDPLYISLAAGGGVNPANVFDMGPILRRLAEACQRAGAMPVLLHHTTKDIPAGKPLQLTDLAYAGFAEFARQWLLVNPRVPFDEGRGLHRLLLGYGGSMGHSGLVAVDVLEGKLDADFGGRVWEVTLATPEEARRQDATARSALKTQDDLKKEEETVGRVLRALDDLGVQVGQRVGHTTLRNAAGLSGDAINKVVLVLEERGVLQAVADSKPKAYARLA
jgi:hypothetical protein